MKKRILFHVLTLYFFGAGVIYLPAQNKIIGISESGPIGSDYSGGMVWECASDGSEFKALKEFAKFKEGLPSTNMILSNGALFGFFLNSENSCNYIAFARLMPGQTELEVLNRFFPEPGSSCSIWLRPICFQGQDSSFYGAFHNNTAGRDYCFKISQDGGMLDTIASFGKTIKGLVQVPNGRLVGALSTDALVSFNPDGSDVQIVKAFSEANDGLLLDPVGVLLGPDGWVYGVLKKNSTGRFFKIKADGTEYQVIYETAPFFSATSMVMGNDNYIYGFSDQDDYIFKLNIESGSFTWLYHSLQIGSFITSKIMQAADGNIYFMTFLGTAENRIYRAYTDGSGIELIATPPLNYPGERPKGALVELPDGRLFGLRFSGTSLDAHGDGFLINTNGDNFETVYIFNKGNALGLTPSLVFRGSDGLIYGVLKEGGPFGLGAVFRMNPDGFNFEHIFNEKLDQLFEGSDGYLYGTRNGIFRLKKDGSQYWEIANDDYGGDLVEATDGRLYYGGSDFRKIHFINKDGSGAGTYDLPTNGASGGSVVKWRMFAISGERLCIYRVYFDKSVPMFFGNVYLIKTNGQYIQPGPVNFFSNYYYSAPREVAYGPDGDIYLINLRFNTDDFSIDTIPDFGCDGPTNGRTLRFADATGNFYGERLQNNQWDIFSWQPADSSCNIIRLWDESMGYKGKPQFQLPVSSGILSLDRNAFCRIYPNPNSGVFIIELSEPARPDATFRITDLAGRLVQEQTADPGSERHTIRAETLPKGLYFLQVLAEGKLLASEKFVKQ